jgi:surface antigen
VCGVIVSAIILFVVLFFVITNSISGNDATTNAIVYTQEFSQNERVTNLTNENVGLSTNSTASWRISDSILPFSKSTLPTRNAPEGEIPKTEYGPGKSSPLAPNNSYVPGQCTWYVYNRRFQLGRPIGNFWGNGGSWHFAAARAGFIVNHTPEVGAVFEQAGHVAVVEEVGLDNSVLISEMNWMYSPFNYHERWVHAADTYWYIH